MANSDPRMREAQNEANRKRRLVRPDESVMVIIISDEGHEALCRIADKKVMSVRLLVRSVLESFANTADPNKTSDRKHQ